MRYFCLPVFMSFNPFQYVIYLLTLIQIFYCVYNFYFLKTLESLCIVWINKIMHIWTRFKSINVASIISRSIKKLTLSRVVTYKLKRYSINTSFVATFIHWLIQAFIYQETKRILFFFFFFPPSWWWLRASRVDSVSQRIC